ncbi:MAG: LytTR family transcriptional regulator DNA-binding domain-containing protein [Oscillospiraceae bacterium]
MLWVLKQLGGPLCPLGFLRVHRSFLVNMLYILKLQEPGSRTEGRNCFKGQ